jgi:catechol 2,3-dioxygenase-like lactoylglutathione lyase family enzyme
VPVADIRHVSLAVSDTERSLALLRDLLGMSALGPDGNRLQFTHPG